MQDEFSQMFGLWLQEGRRQVHTNIYTSAHPRESYFSIEDIERAMKRIPPAEWMLISPAGEMYVSRDPIDFVKVIAKHSAFNRPFMPINPLEAEE